MNQFDQHTAIIALEEALVPAAGLVDSRTEADNLRLLVDIASLFNFYDQTNKINGNWSPFLLKDPVFLVASIAKTSFQKAHSLFINTCSHLETALLTDTNTAFISNAFNQLFDQLTYVFHTIERWTYYMQQSSLEYNLKTYIIQQVKEKQSAVLWALLALKSDLNMNDLIPNIKPVDTYAYENYDQKIWKESKGKQPYWTILGLPTVPCKEAKNEHCFYLSELTPNDLFKAVCKTGKKVFAFYSNCISYAETELVSVQNVPGHFPDTILLRTFTSLLKIYQAQLNSLSEKHLNFYYGDILKQLPKSVSPDTVFAACNLAKKTATFQLPQNTQFSAGLDANKQAILFETTNAVSLNPAKIANTYVLAQANDTSLYLQKLPPVNVISKDEDGAIKSWKTFGSQTTPTGTKLYMAITFGSPLFFLTEANTRTITLTFTLSDSNESDISEINTIFYLSTTETWFKIPKSKIFVTQKSNIVTVSIALTPTDPVITAFTKNPDGYTSDWPLLKMVFLKITDVQNPTKIKTLKIDVDVKELQNFSLYNDFGMLNAKKPFQPLGPSPKVNQNFMVGSAEIFSKPSQDITFQLTWNVFPTDFDFATYYEEYNNYLNRNYSGSSIDIDALKKLFKNIIDLQQTLFTSIISLQDTLFKNVLTSDATKAVQLIQQEQTTLTTAINTENTKLATLTIPVNATIEEIIALNTAMATSINAAEDLLIANIKTTGKVDSSTVNTTKNTVLNAITTTQDSVFLKLLGLENNVLTTTLQEKKSFFEKLKNIFQGKPKPVKLTASQPVFSNASFMVNFQCLQNGLWKTFDTTVSGNTVSSATPVNLFFPSENVDTNIPPTRTFAFSDINLDPKNINPILQKTPLQLSDTSTTGFLKMKLSAPTVGFGTDLYPKVVGAIALFNAEIIAQKIKASGDTKMLVSPPNLPFTPTISSFSGDYTASVSYDFSKNDETYPLECFYNTPFKNYKVFDTIDGINTKNTTIGNSPARDESDKITPLTALPLVPEISSKGHLFLELQDVIAPANVSFYFELARTYTEKAVEKNNVSYSYLSVDGWKTLTSIADGTNGFTCSGIITINIPSDITTEHETMVGTNFWIAMGTNTNLDHFPQTSFLKTNGITLQRIVTSNDFSSETPQIKANSITSPKTAIPEILATVQPFSSFGGKAAETNMQMNSRVSTRLKTKDRLVSAENYFNTIRLEFPEVYYSKTIYAAKKVITYVMKRVADVSDANAFVPLLSECKELEIQKYIKERVSPFVNVSVENFELNYVKINADIQLQSDEDVTTVAKEINNDINIYLAPWITSAQTQITIDTGLNTAQLASFINNYKSVLEVNHISFQIGTKDFATGLINYQPSTQEIAPKDGIMLVPSLENSLMKYHL